MSGRITDKLEDTILNLGRRDGLIGIAVQVLVLGSVGAFYVVGSLGMQTGRLLARLVEKKKLEDGTSIRRTRGGCLECSTLESERGNAN